ncbi:MAG: hypothetical protein ACYTFN_14760 [Planctomycetota bacterium]|jgi:hypothetical protein
MPNLDALGPQQRIDPREPVVAAYLGGRPVVLARPDQRRGGRNITVPVTLSRFRREFDLQSGRASPTYDPSLIDDWPLTHLPFGATVEAMVSKNWQYATLGLGVLVVAQFFWWNAKAPGVLKMSGGY